MAGADGDGRHAAGEGAAAGQDSAAGAGTGTMMPIGPVLQRALSKKVVLRLTTELGGTSRQFAARPIKLLGNGGAEGIWVHLPDEKPGAIDELAGTLPACRANCCIDQVRYAFETSVIQRDKHFWLNDQIMLDALLLAGPTNLLQLQERASERFPVSDRSGVTAQLFRLNEPSGSTNASAGAQRQLISIPSTLKDLSAGGGGFVCPFDRGLSSIRRGHPMGCVIHFRGTKIPMVATLAQLSPISNRTLRVGIKFQPPPDETAAAQRRAELDKVLAELERQSSIRKQVRRAS